jgi:hypothetical protein
MFNFNVLSVRRHIRILPDRTSTTTATTVNAPSPGSQLSTPKLCAVRCEQLTLLNGHFSDSEVRIGPLESCASCASGGAVRAISPDFLSESCISESPQSCNLMYVCTLTRASGLESSLLFTKLHPPSLVSCNLITCGHCGCVYAAYTSIIYNLILVGGNPSAETPWTLRGGQDPAYRQLFSCKL